MIINLKFDFDHSMIYIPDGYVADYRKMQMDFIEWCQDQKEAIVCRPGLIPAYQYSKDLFLKYVNEIILCDCNERAYFVDTCPSKKAITISF